MRELRCGRCDREGPGADRIDAAWSRAARTDPSSVSDLLNDSWARIDGVDVCPSCQTDSDKAQVARRLVDIVENAVRGNDDNDVEPSPDEDAVIGFAMQMREALAAWGGGGDD